MNKVVMKPFTLHIFPVLLPVLIFDSGEFVEILRLERKLLLLSIIMCNIFTTDLWIRAFVYARFLVDK